jgi:hypothetical protein
MSIQGRISSALVLFAMTGAVCSAQTVTSAHSGTLHYFEGDVAIDGNQVQSKFGKFDELKPQSVLSTKLGRAEVLLTPGVFLRLGENSSVRMIDNRLVSTRVDVLSGNVILESDDPQMDVKDSPVVLLYKDYEIRMVKHGLAELNSDPGQLKVFKGEALVEASGDAAIHNRVTVKEGRVIPFSAALVVEKFDEKTGDDLYLWARDRSQVLSAANMSSARTLSSGSGYGYGSGYGFAGVGSGYGGLGSWNGGWYYNPFFGMYTFVPPAGTLWSPWGYGFFSPYSIYSFYAPTSYWYGGGGPVGGSAGGRPVFGLASSTSKPVPIGSLLNSNTGRVNLGSPLRSGAAIGVPASTSSIGSAAATGSAAASSMGSAAVSSSRGGGAGGGFAAGGGGGGGFSGGGGGGHASAGGGGGHR